MAKFRYYIVLTETGEVLGTNDKATANDYAQDASIYVVDSEEGVLITIEDGVPVKSEINDASAED